MREHNNRAERRLQRQLSPNLDGRMNSMSADEIISTQVLTYKCRLLPSAAQHAHLRAALDHTRDLYNAALQERIDCYQKTGRGRTWPDQCKALTELRVDPAWTAYPVALQRWPLKQVDLAFSAFFRRVKSSASKAGFPRFRGREWFKTFGFSDRGGWKLKGCRLRIKGIGSVRVHIHRELPSNPIALKIKREGKHWYALFSVEVPCSTDHTSPAVGVDLGISTLAALSNGDLIPNTKPSKRAQKEVRRRSRALARCKRGSKRRGKVKDRLAAAHAKIARQRDTYLHQVSAALVREFGLIAVEKLNIKGLAAGMLAREVRDASWGKLVNFLRYKVEKTGGALIEVDPKFTSQTCPECGVVKKKELSERTHSCPCGCVLNRDVAAAKVVLQRAGIGPFRLNAVECDKRADGKICWIPVRVSCI
jgi:putative transposase